MHAPSMHRFVAQRLAHAPQFSGFVCVSTQDPPQQV
jgi:hypothetical protein